MRDLAKCWLIWIGSVAILAETACGFDRVSLSLGLREVKAQYMGEKVKSPLPMTQLTFTKLLNERFDFYVQASFLDVNPAWGEKLYRDGEANGSFQSIMLGLRHFPLERRCFGFDFSAGVFFGDYDIDGMAGPLHIDLEESAWGLDVRLGLYGEINLDPSESAQIVWFVGYYLSETITNDAAHTNLDGWTMSVGFQISLGR